MPGKRLLLPVLLLLGGLVLWAAVSSLRSSGPAGTPPAVNPPADGGKTAGTDPVSLPEGPGSDAGSVTAKGTVAGRVVDGGNESD